MVVYTWVGKGKVLRELEREYDIAWSPVCAEDELVRVVHCWEEDFIIWYVKPRGGYWERQRILFRGQNPKEFDAWRTFLIAEGELIP